MSKKNPNSRCTRREKRRIKNEYKGGVPLWESWKVERKFWRGLESPRRRWFYNLFQ